MSKRDLPARALAMLTAFLLTCAPAAAQAPAAGLARIGAAAAVKGLVKAEAPGAVGRVIQSGKPLFLNDRVTTDAAGRLQVLLLDETVFTLGPNSDMVLDEFVYDPVTSAGKVTARVTKGVFRFVTGKVARKDPGQMKVKLPVGTIGIRGTIVAGEAADSQSTVIMVGPGVNNNADENPGAADVTNAGASVNLLNPGDGTTVAAGQTPAPVTNMSERAAQISGSLSEPAPAPQSQGGAGGSGSGDSTASSDAGQDTAAGGANAGTAGEVSTFAGGLDNTQTIATQSQTGASIADGTALWDDVRTIQSGLATFSGLSGTLSCGVECEYQISVNMPIDFANRTIGCPTTSDVALTGSLSNSVRLNKVSFASLTGNAIVTMQYAGGSGNTASLQGDPTYFDGTTLTLLNGGGVAAKDLKVDLTFSDGSITTTGSVTVPR